jgi:hypothetical protein
VLKILKKFIVRNCKTAEQVSVIQVLPYSICVEMRDSSEFCWTETSNTIMRVYEL